MRPSFTPSAEMALAGGAGVRASEQRDAELSDEVLQRGAHVVARRAWTLRQHGPAPRRLAEQPAGPVTEHPEAPEVRGAARVVDAQWPGPVRLQHPLAGHVPVA